MCSTLPDGWGERLRAEPKGLRVTECRRDDLERHAVVDHQGGATVPNWRGTYGGGPRPRWSGRATSRARSAGADERGDVPRHLPPADGVAERPAQHRPGQADRSRRHPGLLQRAPHRLDVLGTELGERHLPDVRDWAAGGSYSDRAAPRADIWRTAASTSSRRNRRCPPKVTMHGIRPSLAQRLMVFGETCRYRAASPGVT